jgi:hypothetical protein
MTVIKKPKKWYVRLFTLGKKFSSQTFSDNTKKFLLNAIGLFVVVTFTFYTESVGEDFEMRNEYIEVSKTISKELDSVLSYTDEYTENLKWASDLFSEQYQRWDVNNDSIFIDFMEDDEEPDGKYYFAPMSLFGLRNAFTPPNLNYKIFKKGTLEFLLINQNISTRIIEIYEGVELSYLKENTDSVEEKLTEEYREIIKKWLEDLDYVDIQYNDFWIKNYRYIQKDKQLKNLIYKRLDLWEWQVFDQLDSYKNTLVKNKNNLDSLIKKMDNEKYFLYWKID